MKKIRVEVVYDTHEYGRVEHERIIEAEGCGGAIVIEMMTIPSGTRMVAVKASLVRDGDTPLTGPGGA